MRALTLLAVGLTAALPRRATAQEVTVTIGLFNPTPYMADWSAKPGMGGLTVTNTTGFDVDLTVTATLLSGAARAAVGQATSDITVIPATASQYYPLPDIARWTQMAFSGAVKQAVQQSGRLPEGTYWLKVTFSNMSANGRGLVDVSDSTLFTITFPQPPKLIAPANGSAIPAPYPTFQWTPVIAPGLLVGYAIRVVEVLPGQTPLQAVQANVPLFDAPVSVATSVLYSPAAYPLEAGTTYAWRVQAISYNPLEFEPPLPIGSNNGFSEVFTFKYAPPAVGVVVVPMQPPPPPKPPGPIVTPGGQPPFNRVLAGKLEYSFSAFDVPTPKKIALAYTGQLPIIPLMEAGGGGTPPPVPAGGFIQPGGGPQGTSAGPPGPSRRPLAGMTVRLVVRYRTLNNYILAGPIIAGGKVYADNGKVVATTTTGSDGKFTFLFHDDVATGTLATGMQVKWGSGDVAVGSEANTSLGRFYQLQVGDPHYLNPSDELTTSATQLDIGTLVSLVRSYSVVVRALKFAVPGAPGTITPEYLPDVQVQLLRQGRPPAVPATEGPSSAWPRAMVAIAPDKYEILGEGQTNGQGGILFRRLVKNVGPNDEYRVRLVTPLGGTKYYHTAFISYHQAWGLGAGKPFDYAAYNEQYNTGLQDTLVVVMIPRLPRVEVIVQRSDNGAALPYGRVDLCYPGVCLKQYLDDDPKHSGTVVWHDLQPKAGAWRIDVGQPGYQPATKQIPTPEMGRQYSYTIPLTPDATLRGRIVDETGAPIWGKARVANGPDQSAHALIAGTKLIAFEFTLVAPSGQQELHITPNSDWFPLDTTITIAKGDNPVRTFTVLHRLHRLRLVVRPYTAAGNVMIKPPGEGGGGGGPSVIAGARVELKPEHGATSDIQIKTTNAQGVVEFLWASTSNDAELRVTGPATSDYVLATPTVTVPVSLSTAFHQDTVFLKPGTRLTGRVYAGTGTATPVAGARVSIVVNGGVLDTLTGPGGEYTLRSVPLGSIWVRATKSLSNYIGDSLKVNAVTPSVTGVDFHLQYYEGINIARLLGFPLEVHSLTTLADNRIRISGALVDAPANTVFADQAPVEPFKFDSVTIEAGPGNAAVPSAGSVHLAASELALDIYGKDLSGVQYTAGGLRARPTAAGPGAVYGAIRLGPLKGLTTGQVSDLPQLNLLQPGATGEARTVLASITADSTSPAGPQGYNVGTETGGAPHFGLIGFSSDVDPAGTFLRADGIHFKATLHTNIPGAGDLALVVPDIHYALGQGFQSSQNDQALAAKLGLWTIAATPWSVNVQSGRVYFQKGEVRAPLNPNKPDATVNFPFTGLEVTPTGFSGGNFNAGPIKLAGFMPLEATGPISLTAVPAEGAWKLVTGGTIKNLPGTRPTDQVALSVFEVHSNGPAKLAPADGQVVRFYETADFTVLGLYLTDAAVSLDGKLDLNVPNLAAGSFLMRYEAGPGAVPKLVPPPLSFAAFDIGGPQLTLTNGTLDASGFKSVGSLAVPGKFTIPVTFLRTPLTANPNRIEATPTPAAQIALGELLVTQLTGGAKVEGGWKTVVGGQLDVNNGQVSGKISLEVAGSDVSMGSAGLSVKNIATPFGDLKLTINFPESRVDGSLQFNADLAAGAHANGAAELAISGKPGNRYWYFFGGADFTLSTPTLGGVAALLVGDAQLSGALLDKFASYSNKGVPESFHDIEGFFLGGKIEVPIPSCPNGSFDVGIANVAVWCTGWGDLQFGMNFNNNNVYHIGLELGVEAGAKGGGGLGACLHVSGKVKTHAGMVGEYRSDGAWFVQGDYGFDLEGEVSGGVGIDDKCIEKSTGFTLGLGAKAQIGHNFNDNTGPYFEVYWK